MHETFQLSIKTLEWAAGNTGKSLLEFAHALYTRDDTVSNIASGKLTIPQIKKFATSAKVPFGFLFLPSPPEKYQPNNELVDFRTVNNRQPLSNDFLDVYKDVEHKQSWYRDYLISIDARKLEFVGKYQDKRAVPNNEIAADIRETIGLFNIAANLKTADEYYSALVKRCEDAGISIFKNSVVVNSNRRRLSSDEFRGFVIADAYAPAIFINGDDTKYANIFTLAHELAHIWLGESGISDVEISSRNNSEIKCNAIAAEVLVPNKDFMYQWENIHADFREKVSTLNKIFKVSELVIARIALTNQKISQDNYKTIHAEVIKRWIDKKRKEKESEGAVPPKIILPLKNSYRITKTIIDLVKSNQMEPGEAAILLNTSAAKLFSLSI